MCTCTAMSRASCGVRNCNGRRDWFSRSFVLSPRVAFNSGRSDGVYALRTWRV